MSQRFSQWCYWLGMILSMIGLALYLSMFFFNHSLYRLFKEIQLGTFSLIDTIPFLMTSGVILHFIAIFIPIKYEQTKKIDKKSIIVDKESMSFIEE